MADKPPQDPPGEGKAPKDPMTDHAEIARVAREAVERGQNPLRSAETGEIVASEPEEAAATNAFLFGSIAVNLARLADAMEIRAPNAQPSRPAPRR